MAGHDIIVVGGSAGGVESSLALVAGLPADLPAAVFLVIHQSPDIASRLSEILDRASPLPARVPQDGATIEPGHIYVARGGYHLLLDDGVVRVAHGPTHNRVRPAVDPLFRSAARSHGARVIGVILSGMLDDGAAGMRTIKLRGGLTVVEQPDTALFSGMPNSALSEVAADHVVPAREMGPLLGRLAMTAAADTPTRREASLDLDFERYMGDQRITNAGRHPSPFSCPDCGGVLWEGEGGGLPDFQCRVGHSYTAESLAREQDGGLEFSLWAAIRSLEEHATLRRRMVERFRRQGHEFAASRAERSADESDRHAENLRRFVTRAMESPDD